MRAEKTNFNEGIYRAVEWLAILHRGELQGTQGVPHDPSCGKRLQKAGAEIHSSRTPFSKLRGQGSRRRRIETARSAASSPLVTGQKDISSAAKGGEKFWCGVRPG